MFRSKLDLEPCRTRHHGTDGIQGSSHSNNAQKPADVAVKGELAPHAASVLMKLLYAARIARFDLLRSMNMLAGNVTKWTKEDDIRLHRLHCLMRYMSITRRAKSSLAGLATALDPSTSAFFVLCRMRPVLAINIGVTHDGLWITHTVPFGWGVQTPGEHQSLHT